MCDASIMSALMYAICSIGGVVVVVEHICDETKSAVDCLLLPLLLFIVVVVAAAADADDADEFVVLRVAAAAAAAAAALTTRIFVTIMFVFAFAV
jgi:cytochrome c oxidase subunit IV